MKYMFVMLERWTNGGYIVRSDCLCVVRGEHNIVALEVWYEIWGLDDAYVY